MITTAYYCPRCGWTVDVPDNDPVPDCVNCNGSMVPLMSQGGRKPRRTAIATAPAPDCNQRPNPFYRQGEG